MGNVWSAIRKHESEQPEKKPGAGVEAKPKSVDGGAEASAPAAPVNRVEQAATKAREETKAAASVTAPESRGKVAPAAVKRPADSSIFVAGTGNTYDKVLVAHYDRGSPITEQYRALRTNLLAQYADKRFSLLITSAEAGEGKTVTTVNLGLVLAERQDCRTVIVDCDLRKSKVSNLLRLPNSPGMVDVLRGDVQIEDVVCQTVYPNLFVIPAGKVRNAEVGELFGRPELEETVEKLRRQYDHVLFDTPPINAVSDTGILARTGCDAIVVVRMNKTHRETVDKAIRLLHAVNVRIMGMILTHQRYYIPDYLYRYS